MLLFKERMLIVKGKGRVYFQHAYLNIFDFFRKLSSFRNSPVSYK